MKRNMVIVAGLAALGIAAYVGAQLWAQVPGGQPNPGPAPASPKIGLINLAAVFKGYNKFSVYNKEMEATGLEYERQLTDIKTNIKKWQEFGARPDAKQSEKEQAEASIKILTRNYEDKANEFKKLIKKKNDDQVIQLYRELEAAVQAYARTNGFHMILDYSEAFGEADKYSAANIQRKLMGPGNSGAVCPVYFVPNMDVSVDVINTLNSMFPAPAAPLPGAAPPAQPKG